MERFPSEDLCRNPRLLSHCGKIISFDCKRDSATNESERSELIFRRLYYEPRDNTFLNAAEGAAVVSRKISAHVDISKCKCAMDVQKRVRTPCILVTKKSEKGESFQYSLLTLSSSNQLEPCIEFKLPYQMKDNVHILHGPTVLWSHDSSVFYTSLNAGGVRKIPIQISHCVFGELPIHKGQVFVLGLQSLSEQCLNSQASRPTLGYFVGDGQVFDGALILPHPYICITQSILVLKADTVDDALKCALVAATSNQQLVYFENGIVKDVCQLPFEQAEDIQLVNTGRNGSLFVIFFQQGNVCAVWQETFQIASRWSGVASIHADDFLGCGTDQMLLVFKDQEVGGLMKKFLITDLCGVSYSRGQDPEAPNTTPPQPENYLLTLQALESRLQSGLIVLQELQREARVKDRVLQQSVRVLTDVASEKETVLTPHEQEDLVALWDDDDDESNDETVDDKMQETPAVPSKPQIDKLWHRVTEDRMVVGVMLTTDTAVPVTSMSLSLLTETSQSSTPAVIQTQSQVFWLPAPCPSTQSSSSTFPEPAAKRSKQPFASNDLNTGRLAATAVTKLAPLLNSGCVKCRVMLHYVQKTDAFSFMSCPTPAVLHCGAVAVDIHNVFQPQLLKTPQLETDEVREDWLTLLAVLDRWIFRIDSPDYSLGDIDGWIQKRVGCKKIEATPQYLLLDPSRPSALILLHWHQITPFQGELTIHSSQLQMLQFLDSLLVFLPPSCLIQPVKGTRCQSTSQGFALALEKEVMSLRQCVSSLLSEENEKEGDEGSTGHEKGPEPGSAVGLQRCREVWQKDVERSSMRLSPLVDVGRYRKLLQSMCEVQMDGDLAALLDTQRTLLS
ncbi:Fanconi anemia group B protein isoform 1-T2 [Odontesthes bonariensis]|uniref:Fanconi anemia group B protein n=1 Tax=Odontesthes bonariensis TaxID=219752 RepID=UPI003F58243D